MLKTSNKEPRNNLVDKLFRIGIIIKGIDGVLEIIGGFILFATPQFLGKIIIFLTQHELAEDSKDFLSNNIIHLYQSVSVTASFGATYLIVHGIIKIFLVASLLMNKLWAYKPMMIFLFLFILYQIIRIFTYHSIALVFLALFDTVILLFVWLEYKKRLR